jgi:hypothetical protein
MPSAVTESFAAVAPVLLLLLLPLALALTRMVAVARVEATRHERPATRPARRLQGTSPLDR